MDLARWWADRRWRALLELIDQLPRASRFKEALYNDPETAEYLAALHEQNDDDVEPWSPRFAEYDLHAHLLREVINALLANRQAVIGAAGGKPGQVVPFPGPITEVDRAMARRVREWAQDFLAPFGFDPSDF